VTIQRVEVGDRGFAERSGQGDAGQFARLGDEPVLESDVQRVTGWPLLSHYMPVAATDQGGSFAHSVCDWA